MSVAHYSKTVSSKFNLMKYVLTSLAFLSIVSAAFANTPPTPQVLSAAMRDGTTIMDITYRVDDPDDATVKVRALAFVDGVRSFANVLRPSSFVEGTAGNLGDAVPANTDRTIAWDVGADWEIDLAQVKFEVLAMDGRGLLPIEWVTIPAAGDEPELTISKNSPTDSEVLDALFWQYADEDLGLKLESGILSGSVTSGIFDGIEIVNKVSLSLNTASPYVFREMDLAFASANEISLAMSARSGIDDTSSGWYVTDRPWGGQLVKVVGWGRNISGESSPPAMTWGAAIQVAAGNNFSLALLEDGTVLQWGSLLGGQIPEGLEDVAAIAAGSSHCLALKNDGTVVSWGNDNDGDTIPPVGLSDVTAIDGGYAHSLALKSDGTVVAWGSDNYGQSTTPSGLSDVIAIAAGARFNLALKNDGTVVGWGITQGTNVPSTLSNVIAITAGKNFGLALKNDGSVVGWGANFYGQSTPPEGLSSVIAIAAGGNHGLALKSDGTVVGWGGVPDDVDYYDQSVPPLGLNGVMAIAAGDKHSLAIQE